MKLILSEIGSQHLIDLGIPKEYASIKEDTNGPTLFTLQDLISITPKEIKAESWHNGLDLRLDWESSIEEWVIGYYATMDEDRGIQFTKIDNELIMVYYHNLCWLLEYYPNLIKDEINKK